MLSWADAHRIAMVAAGRSHRELDIDLTQQIPVFDVIDAQDIMLNFQPLPRLSGAYLAAPGAQTGIVINASHPLPRQRFTAAHELGHHVFGHGTSIDPEGEPLSKWGTKSPPDDEKVAESFAAWFLMPRQLVLNGIDRLGILTVRSDTDAYRLSTFLGCSYEATVRHLQTLRLITAAQRTAWLKTSPLAIKRRLAAPAEPTTARNDVVVLDASANGAAIEAHSGDLLLVDLVEPSSGGYEWELELPGPFQMLDEQYQSPDGGVDGAAAVHRFVITIVDDDGLDATGERHYLNAELVRGWVSGEGAPEPAESRWTVIVRLTAKQRGVFERWLAAA